MNIISISINHRTAPIELREALHLSENEVKDCLQELRSGLLNEALILSTCNRTEIFGIPKDHSTTFKELQKYLIIKKQVSTVNENNFQNYFSCGAVNHLFHVSAGIDSLVIGDQQIFGQVKDAFNLAIEENTVGTFLQKTFQSALKVGKRVKTETELYEGSVSISSAAVQLASKIFSDLKKKSVLVIGAGETGKLTIQNLLQKNVTQITITNRTLERAKHLAETCSAKILPFENFREHLHKFDIIISSTSAENPIISFEEMKKAISLRKNSPICIMDIAIPRDFDPKVKEIENIFYNDIDALQSIVNQNIEMRKTQIPKIKKIIIEELIELFSWYNSLKISPLLKSLRGQLEQIREQEYNYFKNKFRSEDAQNLELLTKRIINKILHNPTMFLKKTVNDIDTQGELQLKINIIKEMFNINNDGNE